MSGIGSDLAGRTALVTGGATGIGLKDGTGNARANRITGNEDDNILNGAAGDDPWLGLFLHFFQASLPLSGREAFCLIFFIGIVVIRAFQKNPPLPRIF